MHYTNIAAGHSPSASLLKFPAERVQVSVLKHEFWIYLYTLEVASE